MTRQQTLNPSLFIHYHLHLQTFWQILFTEVVTFYYSRYLMLCLLTVPPFLISAAAAQKSVPVYLLVERFHLV